MLPSTILGTYLGAGLSSNTRYLEYQDGTIMTDGIFIDHSNTTFPSLYGDGDTTRCFVLDATNQDTHRCSSVTTLCEKYLHGDTHLCLNKALLDTSMTLEPTAELTVSSNTISSGLCIQYCRGMDEQYKYVIVDEDKCTCAKDKLFDDNTPVLLEPDALKQVPSKCSWSASKTMIGNQASNVVALYNIEPSRFSSSVKLSPTDCRVYEHELFYSQLDMQWYPVQSEVGKPILKFKCQFKDSSVCVYPLLHSMDETSFSSEGGTEFGQKSNLAAKMYTGNSKNIAYLDTYTDKTYWRWSCKDCCDPQKPECLVHNQTLANGDFVTLDELRVVITFPKLTLITGIWWSNSHSTSSENAIIKNINNFDFTFPDSMGGDFYRSQGLLNNIKYQSSGRNNLDVTFLSQPILTQELSLSGFQYEASSTEWNRGHRLRFSMELFGCEDYQADKCKFHF